MKKISVCCAAVVCLCAAANAQPGANQQSATVGTSSFVDVGEGTKVWYEACGAAKPGEPGVVLLHDGLVHSVTWDGVWAPLCAKYHVVRYDRRGYGRSDAAKAMYAPEEDMYKVMRQAHIDRAIVVGNSSGGALALDFALAHPEMTDGLFLIGPVVHGMASSDYFGERGARNMAPLDKGDEKGAAENWSKDRFIIGGDDARARKALFDALSQNPRNMKVSGIFEIRPSPPTVQRLGQIRVPVLILVGESDIADVFAESGAIWAGVPLGTFEVWKNYGHLIQLQAPTELAKRFDRFVASSVERKEVPLSETQRRAYAGEYKLGPQTFQVFLTDGRLVAQFPGSPGYWLFAASETRFFFRNDDAEVEFHKDAAGKVTEMVIHNGNGSTFSCSRVDGEKSK